MELRHIDLASLTVSPGEPAASEPAEAAEPASEEIEPSTEQAQAA